MHSIACLKSITFAVLLNLTACTTAKQGARHLEPGRVTQIVVNLNNQRINHFTPLWCATWLAAIGFGIGTGSSAHAIGAGSGALLGTGLGYAQENQNSKRVTRTVDVRVDSGVLYCLPSTDGTVTRIGQRVWIAFDKSGRPDHIVTVPSA